MPLQQQQRSLKRKKKNSITHLGLGVAQGSSRPINQRSCDSSATPQRHRQACPAPPRGNRGCLQSPQRSQSRDHGEGSFPSPGWIPLTLPQLFTCRPASGPANDPQPRPPALQGFPQPRPLHLCFFPALLAAPSHCRPPYPPAPEPFFRL